MLKKEINASPEANNTERLILAAAEKEFMTKGFAGARTTSIAKEAGVTHAMFHYYFRTKEKLFERILDEKTKLLAEALLQPLEDMSLPIEELVKKIVTAHIDFLAAHPDLARFLFIEINTDDEHAAEHRALLKSLAARVLLPLQNKLDHAHACGKCRKLDARMLMLDIASLNIFPFLAMSPIKAVFGDTRADFTEFIECRKAENIDTILRKIR